MRIMTSRETDHAVETLAKDHKRGTGAKPGVTVFTDEEDKTYEIYIVTGQKYRAAFKAMWEALPDA